ncbi:MAG TPA: hypothetical protein EYH07_04400 [Kiloniellaceae bacterium]|nr:hypothetical protein [Kiloniellaceae bacterium]
MRLTRRRALTAPLFLAGAGFLATFPLISTGSADPPASGAAGNPFRPGTAHHHAFFAMRQAIPRVEARLRRWVDLAQREAQTLATSDHPALVRWRRDLASLPEERSEALVQKVNLLVNRDVRYRSDWNHGHVRDKWYGPVESLEEGGDCEDYALLKGLLLHSRGWPDTALHLVAGVLASGEGHMMLGVDYADGRQMLLDNLTPRLHARPFDGWTPKYQIGAHQQSLVYIKAF